MFYSWEHSREHCNNHWLLLYVSFFFSALFAMIENKYRKVDPPLRQGVHCAGSDDFGNHTSILSAHSEIFPIEQTLGLHSQPVLDPSMQHSWTAHEASLNRIRYKKKLKLGIQTPWIWLSGTILCFHIAILMYKWSLYQVHMFKITSTSWFNSKLVIIWKTFIN